MRTWGLLVIAIAACANTPTLEVIVEHVPGDPTFAPLVTRTTVSVYETSGLTCTPIEFGDIPDDVLVGAVVAQAEAGQPLSNVSRTQHKVIVARGYGADGTLIAAGCAEKDTVVDDDSVTVTTVPTATVTVGTGVPTGVLVTATDIRNASIDDRPVYWRIYGAAGTSASPALASNTADGIWEPLAPSCTSDGEVQIHPVPPALPGGFALRLRISWATEPVPLVSTFTPFNLASMPVSSGPLDGVQQRCAVQRHSGAVAIICMTSQTTFEDFTYASGALTASAPTAIPAPTNGTDQWIGVVTIPGTGTDQDVYAISNRGQWQALDGAPAAASGDWCRLAQGLPCATIAATQLQIVPACGTKPSYLLARVSEMPKLRAIGLKGGVATSFAMTEATIHTAGCVDELQADGTAIPRQVVVVDSTTPPATTATFECAATGGQCNVVLPTTNTGVGFYPGAEPRLIGTTFDASGSSLAQWVFIAAGAKDRLVTRATQVAANVPRQLVTGNFDNDGSPDLLWSFGTRNDVDMQVAYARTAEGVPLTAFTPIAGQGLLTQPTDLFAIDINGDGYDEVVVVVATAGTADASLAVIPTGVPYTPAYVPPATADPGCP